MITKAIKDILFYIPTILFQKIQDRNTEMNYNKLRKQYNINPLFRFNGSDTLIYGDGEFIAGDNSYIGRHSRVVVGKNCKVVIGKNCKISHNTYFYTHSSDPNINWEIEDYKDKLGDIVIKDHAWIGANVFINPGVTIGKCSVVGANSVVTKDIPDFTIYGGVPAKLIRNK